MSTPVPPDPSWAASMLIFARMTISPPQVHGPADQSAHSRVETKRHPGDCDTEPPKPTAGLPKPQSDDPIKPGSFQINRFNGLSN